MSIIGSGNIGALHIAGSFAGAQRTESDTDRTKAEAAEKKFQADQKSLSSNSMDDVAEADLSPDRDPDGRLPYSAAPALQEDKDAEDGRQEQKSANRDAFGDRGSVLDLEA